MDWIYRLRYKTSNASSYRFSNLGVQYFRLTIRSTDVPREELSSPCEPAISNREKEVYTTSRTEPFGYS